MVSFDLTAYILSSEGNMKCRVRQWFLLLTLITIIGVLLYAIQLDKGHLFILSRKDSNRDSSSPSITIEESSSSLINREFDKNFKKIEEMLSTRMKKVSAYCNATHKNYHTYNTYHFPELKILWVPSFKAGSSTWRDYFIDATKEENSTEHKPYQLDLLEERKLEKTSYHNRSNPRKLMQGFQKDMVSFMQVRHPINRLISLHLSTARLKSDIGSMKSWGMEAIIDSRISGVPSNMTQLYKQELEAWMVWRGKWEQGLSEKVDEDFIERALNFSSPNNPYFWPPFPKFDELVAHIIKRRFSDNKSYNGHWFPASEWGDVCQNNLNYIIKLENCPTETLFILNKTNSFDEEDLLLKKHNPSNDNKDNVVYKSNKSEGFTDFRASDPSMYHHWMGMLSWQQKSKLKLIYEEDFRLFNYDYSMLDDIIIDGSGARDPYGAVAKLKPESSDPIRQPVSVAKPVSKDSNGQSVSVAKPVSRDSNGQSVSVAKPVSRDPYGQSVSVAEPVSRDSNGQPVSVAEPVSRDSNGQPVSYAKFNPLL